MATTYTQLLQDPLDFVIRRQNSRSSQILAVIVSHHQAYLKDEKTGKTILIMQDEDSYKEKATVINKLVDFFKDYREQKLDLIENTWAFGFNDFDRDAIRCLCRFLNEKNVKQMVMAGYISAGYGEDKFETSYTDPNARRVIGKLVLDTKTHEYNKSGETGKYNRMIVTHYASMFKLTKLLCSRFDEKDAYRFFTMHDYYMLKRQLAFQSLTGNLESAKTLPMLDVEEPDEKECISYDFDAWSDYVTREMAYQGLDSNYYGNIHIWNDALYMQVKLFGSVKNKYPKRLISYHNMLSNEIRIHAEEIKKAEIETEKKIWESTIYPRLRRFEKTGDDWLTVVPHSPQDMLDEAKHQHNCLASYIDNVRNMDTNIVFLRQKDKPDTPYITIEIGNDNKMIQAYAQFNANLNEHMRKQVDQWLAQIKGDRK